MLAHARHYTHLEALSWTETVTDLSLIPVKLKCCQVEEYKKKLEKKTKTKTTKKKKKKKKKGKKKGKYSASILSSTFPT